jgi:hypothetical protein
MQKKGEPWSSRQAGVFKRHINRLLLSKGSPRTLMNSLSSYVITGTGASREKSLKYKTTVSREALVVQTSSNDI